MSSEGRFDWLVDRWNQFWFDPARSTDLGGARILFYGITLIAYWRTDLALWSSIPREFWMPTSFFRAFGNPLLAPLALTVVDVTWKVSLGLSAIGLYTRASTAVAAVLGWYCLGLPQNFGKVHHSDTLLVLLLVVLAASRAGDACSVDRLRRLARSGGRREPVDPPVGSEYRWPARFALVLLVIAFVGAGISKLRISGFGWVLSDNMRNTLLAHHYTHRPPTNLGLWLADHPWLTLIVAAGSLSLELGTITALFSRRARAVVIASLAAMQVGIWLMMGVLFLGYASVYPVLVPWSSAGAWIRSRLAASRSRVVMLYDGSCGVCSRTMRVLGALDILGLVEFLDIVGQWEAAETRFKGLDRVRCLADMHVINAAGTVRAGYPGYQMLAWRIPLFWPLVPLLMLPPVTYLGRMAYRRVADGRLRHGCELPWGVGK